MDAAIRQTTLLRMTQGVMWLMNASGVANAFCFADAARPYAALGMDEPLLRAVVQTESSMRPDAIGRNRGTTTGSVDIGLMQINSGWLPTLRRYGVSQEQLLNPCTNLKVGAWVLAQNLQRLGNRWEAVGAYNAGCTRLAAAQCHALRGRYAWRVYANLRRPDATPAPAPEQSRMAAPLDSVGWVGPVARGLYALSGLAQHADAADSFGVAGP